MFLNIARRAIDGDWEPLEDQVAFGVSLFLWQEKNQPEGFVIGVQRSEDDDSLGGLFDIKLELLELYAGAVKSWEGFKGAQVHVGGGFSVLEVELEVTDPGSGLSGSEADRVFAPYVAGGIFWSLGRRFRIGVDLRWVLLAEAEIAGFEVDTDFRQLGTVFGVGW